MGLRSTKESCNMGTNRFFDARSGVISESGKPSFFSPTAKASAPQRLESSTHQLILLSDHPKSEALSKFLKIMNNSSESYKEHQMAKMTMGNSQLEFIQLPNITALKLHDSLQYSSNTATTVVVFAPFSNSLKELEQLSQDSAFKNGLNVVACGNSFQLQQINAAESTLSLSPLNMDLLDDPSPLASSQWSKKAFSSLHKAASSQPALDHTQQSQTLFRASGS